MSTSQHTPEQVRRAAAGRRLVAEYSERNGREPDWDRAKAALEDDLEVEPS